MAMVTMASGCARMAMVTTGKQP